MKKIFFLCLTLFFGTTHILSQHKKNVKTIAPKKTIVKQAQKENLIVIVDPHSLQLLSKSKQPLLIKIHADWCGPCQRMMPTFEKIALSFSGKVKAAKLMMKSFRDSDPVINFLKKEYNVTINCVPTFLLIINNKVIKVFEGSMSFDEFNKQLLRVLEI
ncbi:thioredoxin family protein [Candidatus Babeliales bacterium]|nr:thioredoxin family protein [Candidatus Babeliales bacterium]